MRKQSIDDRFIITDVIFRKIYQARIFKLEVSMPKYLKSFLFVIFLFSFLIANNLSAQLADSPWSMFCHDAQHTGRSSHNGPQAPTLKWKVKMFGNIDTSPVIDANGTIYNGFTWLNNGLGYAQLYAINPDGTQKWLWSDSQRNSNFFDTPAIGIDGTIYFGTLIGEFYALNPDGSQKWRYSLGSGEFQSSPAIGIDGTIYVGYGANTNYFCAFNPDLTVKWTYPTDSPIFSSPAIGNDGTIYFGPKYYKFFALNPDGSLKWSYDFEHIGDLFSSPTIGGNGAIYVLINRSGGNGGLYSFNPDGSLNCFFNMVGSGWFTPASTPAIGADGTIYLGSNSNKFYAINPNCTLKWSFMTGDDIVSSPAIGANGIIYFGSKDDNLYALNPDGSLKWTYKTGDDVVASPAIGSDGTLYVSSYDSYVYAFKDEIATPTPTPTLTPTPTDTDTITPTTTKTPSNTNITTLTATQTPTDTKTPTITPSPSDLLPILDGGKVTPDIGYQSTTFEYSVHYKDPDGGSPPVKRVYINGVYKTMSLKSGLPDDGIYNYLISGYELNVGNKEYYFFFSDDENNYVRLPDEGYFNGPLVTSGSTPTPEVTITPSATLIKTPSVTPTPNITETATIILTPIITPTLTETPIEDCLRITSPSDFYYNTVLLSWTPVIGAKSYSVELNINDSIYPFDLGQNYVIVFAHSRIEWQSFVDIGEMKYRVTALDISDEVIKGPTDWVKFKCFAESDEPTDYVPQAADSSCLRISSPSEFYYNTILLSWTPVNGAAKYKFKYRYSTWIYEADIEQNYLRLIAPDETTWNNIKELGKIFFSVTAIDANGNIIDGPTPWTSFVCN
jgi:outer membrane protein assembly factor BamB